MFSGAGQLPGIRWRNGSICAARLLPSLLLAVLACAAYSAQGADIPPQSWPRLQGEQRGECTQALRLARQVHRSSHFYVFEPPPVPQGFPSTPLVHATLPYPAANPTYVDPEVFDELPVESQPGWILFLQKGTEGRNRLATSQPTAAIRILVKHAWATRRGGQDLAAWAAKFPWNRALLASIRRQFPLAHGALEHYYCKHFGLSRQAAQRQAAYVLDVAFRAHYVFSIARSSDESVPPNPFSATGRVP